MKRGHAEALMPLIARVMQAADLAFAALDRIAVTTGPGSFTGLRVGISAARGIALAASKPVVGVTTLAGLCRAVVGESGRHPVISAIDARHDHVYFQVVSGDGSPLMRPRVAPIDEALAASHFGAPHLVGNAANILADRWPEGAAAAGRGRPAARARHRLGGLARRRGRSATTRRRGRSICARPTPSRQQLPLAAQAAAVMMSWLSEWWRGGTAVVEPAPRATPHGSRSCTAPRFTADGAKANSRAC